MSTKATRVSTYKKGYPLAEAAFKFAPEPMQRAYLWADKRKRARGAAAILNQLPTLRDSSVPPETKDHIAQALGIDWRKGSSDSFCDRDGRRYRRVLNHRKKDPIEYNGQMRTKLVADIHDGKFVARGYLEPRKPNDRSISVPDDVMKATPEIIWETSSLSGNGLKFVAVRLVPAGSLNYQRDKDTDKSGKLKRRKSRKIEVVAAYTELRRATKICAADTYKAIHKKIYDLLVKRTGNPHGLRYSTLFPFIEEIHLSWQEFDNMKS